MGAVQATLLIFSLMLLVVQLASNQHATHTTFVMITVTKLANSVRMTSNLILMPFLMMLFCASSQFAADLFVGDVTLFGEDSCVSARKDRCTIAQTNSCDIDVKH